METISFLPIEDMRILKQIIIVSDFPRDRELSVGYIVYERTLTNSYRLKEVDKKSNDFNYLMDFPKQELYPHDNIDDIIFQAVQNQYPKSVVRNHHLLFNVDQEKVKRLKDRETVVSQISFTPDFSSFDIFSNGRRSFDGLVKQVTIFNDFSLDYIRNVAFNGYYNLQDQQILNDIRPIVFY